MGYDPWAGWLVASYALYLVAGLCWLPAVWLQIRMSRLARAAASAGTALPPAYAGAFRAWFLLGWPGFLSVVALLFLMVVRPA